MRGSSVHLATFAKPGALRDGIPDHLLTRLENWPQLIAVRDEVLKALEAARQQKLIRSGLEARVSLEVFNSDPLESSNDVAELERFRSLLEEYQAFLPALFIVSQVEILPGVSAASNARLRGFSGSIAREGGELGLRVLVEKARGLKCARCWNYSEQVGKDKRYPEVCERCSAALREIENGSQ